MKILSEEFEKWLSGMKPGMEINEFDQLARQAFYELEEEEDHKII